MATGPRTSATSTSTSKTPLTGHESIQCSRKGYKFNVPSLRRRIGFLFNRRCVCNERHCLNHCQALQTMPFPLFLMSSFVNAEPYLWPYNGDLRPENTVFLVIDMQTDFCGPGGYVDKMGYDLSLTRAPIEPIKRFLGPHAPRVSMRSHREGHRPISRIYPPINSGDAKQIGAGIGDAGSCGRILTQGEPGWDIIPELASPFRRANYR